MLGAGADAGEPAHRSGARKRASRPGGTTVMPPGLRRSEATLQTTFDVETPSEQDSEVARANRDRTASATRACGGEVRRRRCRGRGSPRRAPCARLAARPRRWPPTPRPSTAGRARAEAARTRPRGSGGAPRPRSWPSGSRTCERRSSPSRRRLVRSDRRRRRAGRRAAPAPRAPPQRRRTRRDRDARRSASSRRRRFAG